MKTCECLIVTLVAGARDDQIVVTVSGAGKGPGGRDGFLSELQRLPACAALLSLAACSVHGAEQQALMLGVEHARAVLPKLISLESKRVYH